MTSSWLEIMKVIWLKFYQSAPGILLFKSLRKSRVRPNADRRMPSIAKYSQVFKSA